MRLTKSPSTAVIKIKDEIERSITYHDFTGVFFPNDFFWGPIRIYQQLCNDLKEPQLEMPEIF